MKLGRIGSGYRAGMGKVHTGTIWDNSGKTLSTKKTKSSSKHLCKQCW